MKKIIFFLMAAAFIFSSAVQAAQTNADPKNMKEASALGKEAVANYKDPEIKPTEVAGLGLQLFLVDLWKFDVDNSKGNNAY